MAFPRVIEHIIAEYAAQWVLCSWAQDHVEIDNLVKNPNSGDYFERLKLDRFYESQQARLRELCYYTESLEAWYQYQSHSEMKSFRLYGRRSDWESLSPNPLAIELLRQNLDKVSWKWLSLNSAAIGILMAHPENIDWDTFSANPNAIYILCENVEKINWNRFSGNPMNTDMAMRDAGRRLLQLNPQKVNWVILSSNPVIFEPGDSSSIEDAIMGNYRS